MVAQFIAALPRLGIGLVVIATSTVFAPLMRWLVVRLGRKRGGHDNLWVAVGRIVFVVTILVNILIAFTIAFPSFTIGSVIQLLGVSGVVVGFAFKDIFQNFLAGLLILFTRPFKVGDQIVICEFEGTVEEVQTRATFLRTYDRRRVVVPNADLFTKPVIVNTAFAARRVEYDVDVPIETDVERL